MDTGKLQERIHGIMVSDKEEDMEFWQVNYKLQEIRHGILVSYKK